ncbi:hypothetical protein [Actinomadura rupiterrae]|uniref:hypothetical protein n=1 Tax=Actinomadura rupiterrae TaxID=559627 RepID=UPI0020A37B7D|nr:hypothetical protein [Actinomadura rupiterrae]MCP2341850.1 hypothetical protein [Actinomadura rupiterrae]
MPPREDHATVPEAPRELIELASRIATDAFVQEFNARAAETARQALVALTTAVARESQSAWKRRRWAEAWVEGWAEGQARAVLAGLRSRDLSVSPQAAEQIESCKDFDQLAAWVAKVALVGQVDEMFG